MKLVYTTILLLASGCTTLMNPTMLQLASEVGTQASAPDNQAELVTGGVEPLHCPNGYDEAGKCIRLICQRTGFKAELYCSRCIDERNMPAPCDGSPRPEGF